MIAVAKSWPSSIHINRSHGQSMCIMHIWVFHIAINDTFQFVSIRKRSIEIRIGDQFVRQKCMWHSASDRFLNYVLWMCFSMLFTLFQWDIIESSSRQCRQWQPLKHQYININVSSKLAKDTNGNYTINASALNVQLIEIGNYN